MILLNNSLSDYAFNDEKGIIAIYYNEILGLIVIYQMILFMLLTIQ